GFEQVRLMSLLVANGGKYTSVDLDKYLGAFNTVALVYRGKRPMSSDALQVEEAGPNIIGGGILCSLLQGNEPAATHTEATNKDRRPRTSGASLDGRLCQGARTRVDCVNDEARRNAGDDRHRAWDANCPRNRTVVCVRLFGELGNSGRTTRRGSSCA